MSKHKQYVNNNMKILNNWQYIQEEKIHTMQHREKKCKTTKKSLQRHIKKIVIKTEIKDRSKMQKSRYNNGNFYES